MQWKKRECGQGEAEFILLGEDIKNILYTLITDNKQLAIWFNRQDHFKIILMSVLYMHSQQLSRNYWLTVVKTAHNTLLFFYRTAAAKVVKSTRHEINVIPQCIDSQSNVHIKMLKTPSADLSIRLSTAGFSKDFYHAGPELNVNLSPVQIIFSWFWQIAWCSVSCWDRRFNKFF